MYVRTHHNKELLTTWEEHTDEHFKDSKDHTEIVTSTEQIAIPATTTVCHS